MNAKLMINIVLIAIIVKMAPYITTMGSGTLLQYQDYLVAGLISFLVMPFVKPLFE